MLLFVLRYALALLMAGCSLDRSPILGRPDSLDAGLRDGGGHRGDAGPIDACTPTGDPTDDCDGVDDDCDGMVDEDCTCATGQMRSCGPCDDGSQTCTAGVWGACGGGTMPTMYYRDADGDSFGDPAMTMALCAPMPGWVSVAGDCDDDCVRCHAGFPAELCGDGRDNDCDTGVDDSTCPCDVFTISTGDYLFCRTLLSWADARVRCMSFGGDLVSFETPAEDAAVYARLATFAYPDQIWFGGTDAGMEGTWVWASGVALATCSPGGCVCPMGCNWQAGQPNGGVGDDCTTMNPTWPGTYGDWVCTLMQAFVCEL